jgi:hypothetical protein
MEEPTAIPATIKIEMTVAESCGLQAVLAEKRMAEARESDVIRSIFERHAPDRSLDEYSVLDVSRIGEGVVAFRRRDP